MLYVGEVLVEDILMKHASSVIKKINSTRLKHVEYKIVYRNEGYTAEFVCLSDLEQAEVLRLGFIVMKG